MSGQRSWQSTESTAVSAPGKVLLTGAYLVLEQPNSGLVLSTSARFFAVVKPLHKAGVQRGNVDTTEMRIVSPQLQQATDYCLHIPTLKLKKASLSANDNPFVENAIVFALAAASVSRRGSDAMEKFFFGLREAGLEITLLGDNDFYSHRKQLMEKQLPLTTTSLASLPLFSPVVANSAGIHTDQKTPQVAKTGLGSSAAMTAAVTGAIMQHFGAVHLPRKVLHNSLSDISWPDEVLSDLEAVHKVAQAAHCAAQGKIGSGFDISSAVFGSQRYVRFSPCLLQPVLAHDAKEMPIVAMEKILEQTWDGSHTFWALPEGLELMIGEPGAGGSCTPSMVGAVQKWRSTNVGSAGAFWSDLASANHGVEAGLLDLRRLASQDLTSYRELLNICSSHAATQWHGLCSEVSAGRSVSCNVIHTLLRIHEEFQIVRKLLREIGNNAQVPIEPESQSTVLDLTTQIPGVLMAGVPGAGGYDAVFAVVIGEAVKRSVADAWSRMNILTLCAVEDASGLLYEQKDLLQLIGPLSTEVLRMA